MYVPRFHYLFFSWLPFEQIPFLTCWEENNEADCVNVSTAGFRILQVHVYKWYIGVSGVLLLGFFFFLITRLISKVAALVYNLLTVYKCSPKPMPAFASICILE